MWKMWDIRNDECKDMGNISDKTIDKYMGNVIDGTCGNSTHIMCWRGQDKIECYSRRTKRHTHTLERLK